MASISHNPLAPTTEELSQMHALYRQGGQERQMAPKFPRFGHLSPDK